MRQFAAAVIGIAFALAGTAVAQDKKAEKEAPKVAIKVVMENDKVKVYEATYAPGAENHAVASSSIRVVRALTGGTLERRHADGKKEIVEWKPGMVQYLAATSAYTTKNVGKTALHLYVVQLK